MKNKYLSLIVGAGIVASFVVVLPAFAQTQPGGPNGFGGGGRFGMGAGMRGGPAMPPGVFGTVDTISGDTLQITSKIMRPNASSTPATVYTVDATNATVVKNGATSTVSSIAVGDMVMVRGTVTGTNVTATMIRDGIMGMMGRPGAFASSTRGMPGMNAFGRRPTSTRSASSTPPFQGNGEPVIAGSIASISGSSLTVTNASNITYTVDASNATIVNGKATSTISNISVGDNVVVQGVVNGTSVTASSIIDQGSGSKGNGKPAGTPPAGPLKIFSAIGNFFKHIFGF
jgi:hypothetical protein